MIFLLGGWMPGMAHRQGVHALTAPTKAPRGVRGVMCSHSSLSLLFLFSLEPLRLVSFLERLDLPLLLEVSLLRPRGLRIFLGLVVESEL